MGRVERSGAECVILLMEPRPTFVLPLQSLFPVILVAEVAGREVRRTFDGDQIAVAGMLVGSLAKLRLDCSSLDFAETSYVLE